MNSKITDGIRRLADALTTKNVLRLVGVLAAVFALFLIPATAGAAGGIVSTLSDTFYTLISHALYWLAYGLGKVTVVLFGVLVQVAQYNDFIHAEAVRLGWVILRDIANMLFILVLLVIAFGTAFRIQQYRYTVLLRQLIIMAVLINFSLSITGFFIDITQVVTLTFVNAFADTAAGNLTTAVGLDKVLRLDPNVPAAEVTNLSIAATLLLGVIFIAVTAVVTVLYVVIFLTRIVALWLLAIMSPIAYLANVFPSTKQYWGRWWKTFWNYALVGPLLAFFLWLTLSVTQAGNSALQIVNTDEKSTFESGGAITSTISEIGSQAGILSFLVAILLLVMSLKMATEFGVAGSRWAQASFDKVQKNAANISRAAAKGVAGGLYRVTAQGLVEKGALGVTSRLARTRLPFLNEAALGWNARLSGYQAKRAKGQEDLLNSVQDERIIERFANSTAKDPLSDTRRRIAQKMAPGSIKDATERDRVLQNMNPADFRSVRANRMHRLALQFGSDHITDLYPDLARAVVQGGTENQKTALGLKGVAYDRRKNSFLFPAPPGSPAGTPPSTTGPRPTPQPPLGYQPNKPFADVDRARYNETRNAIRQRFGNNPEAFFQSPEYKLNAARFVGHDDFLEAFEGQQERQRKIERGETRLAELTGIRTATAKGGRGEGATLALDFAEGRSLGLNLGNAAGLNLSAAEKQKAVVALSGKYRQQETEKEVARRHKEMQESADRDYEQQRSEAQQRGEGETAQRRLVTEDEAVAAVQADVAFQGQLATKTQDFRSALQNAKSLRLINKGRVGRAPKRILRHEQAHDAVDEMDPKELKTLWDQLDADRQQEIEQYVRQNWPDGAAMTPEQVREEFFTEVMANAGRTDRLGPLDLIPEEQKEKYLATRKTIEDQFDGNVKAFYRSKQYRDNPLQYLQQQDVERAAREEQILQQLADSKTLNNHERAMTGVAALPDDGIEAAWGVLPEERQQELEDYLAESSDQLNFLRRGDNRARFEATRRMIAETYGGNHRAFFDSNEFRKNKKAFLNEKDFWRGDEELLALKKEALGEMLASFNGAKNEGPINFADSEKDIALLLRASAEKKRLLTAAPVQMPSGVAVPRSPQAAATAPTPADLARMSQNEFASYLGSHRLEETDLYELLTRKAEYRHLRKQDLAQQMVSDPKLQDAMREFSRRQAQNWNGVRSGNVQLGGVKAIGSDSAWNNYEVGQGKTSGGETHKGYLTFKDPLADLTPEKFNRYLEELARVGYNGQVKIAPAGSRAKYSFDNVVMHGATPEDVQKAAAVARNMFSDQLAAVGQGIDRGGKSHSQLLEEAVKAEREARKSAPPPPPTPPQPTPKPQAPPPAGSRQVSASPPERVVERRFEAPISPIVTTNVINNTTVKSVAGELSQRLEGQIGALPMRDMLYSLQRMQDTILQVARQQGIEAKELAGINGEIDRLKADVRRPEKTRKEDEALHANLRTFLKKIHGRGSDDDASDSDSNDEPTMAA